MSEESGVDKFLVEFFERGKENVLFLSVLKAQDLIPDDGYRAQLFGALSSYQSYVHFIDSY